MANTVPASRQERAIRSLRGTSTSRSNQHRREEGAWRRRYHHYLRGNRATGYFKEGMKWLLRPVHQPIANVYPRRYLHVQPSLILRYILLAWMGRNAVWLWLSAKKLQQLSSLRRDGDDSIYMSVPGCVCVVCVGILETIIKTLNVLTAKLPCGGAFIYRDGDALKGERLVEKLLPHEEPRSADERPVFAGDEQGDRFRL